VLELGSLGIRTGIVDVDDEGAWVDAAREAEELGFGALWIPSQGPVFERAASIVEGTKRIVVIPSVMNVWTRPAAELAADHHGLVSRFPGRFVLGLGISHRPIVEGYSKPVTSMLQYLDELDTAPTPVPAGERIIAAIWPRMLGVSRDRSAGTHPYLVTPGHTRGAREILGPGPVLAPGQVVVLERDAARARELGRNHLQNPYLSLPNYANNFLREGFTQEDLDGRSDRLVDGIVAWGDEAAIAERVREHHDAGASHVALQVVTGDRSTFPREQWRALAAALPHA
jgi:probable F420-dependent oxidoreductase